MRTRSILWNLLGLGLPLLIAAITVPKLLTLIGSERFGFLALAWGLIGYAGALDLGMGRATTQRVAALIGARDEHLVPDILVTATRITQYSGLVGMALIGLAALFGAYRLIPVNSVPEHEIRISMFLLALALPMQAVSATYRGVNEAYQNFKGISILRIALGAANFGTPYLVSLLTNNLYWLVGTLVLSRAIALIIYRKLALSCIGGSSGKIPGAYNKIHVKELLRFGGWFTVSSVLSPLLVQADRFFVGYLISATAVTLYVLPYEVTVQALIVVGAVTSVAFPAIASLLAKDPDLASLLFRRWLVRVSAGTLLLMSALALIMPYLLRFWVGGYVSEDSIRVGQILCIGVFFNSVGAMYFSFLHALGKTKETALLHLVEFPIFVGLLYYLILNFGIVGAAIAWVVRVLIDTLALIFIAGRVSERMNPRLVVSKKVAFVKK